MTEIRFYHLTTRSLDDTLPEILSKAYARGDRVVVRTLSAAEAEKLASHLWSFSAESFLPHGTKKDGKAEQQPIWITPDNDNPSNAVTEIVTDGRLAEESETITLICDVFDGRSDDAVSDARKRWTIYKDAGHDLTYWKQGAKGWEKAG